MDERAVPMKPTTYYSVLRWRPSPGRDEGRNVAVVLVGDGTQGGIRHAPIHGISPKLREQGLLDAALEGFKTQFLGDHKLTLGQLEEFRASPSDSLYFTAPQPATGPDAETILGALYQALVAPGAGGGSRIPTKGKILTDVVSDLRREGWTVSRGEYVKDFLFDVVPSGKKAPLLCVLSFATSASAARTWEAVEKDAGHFLYGLEHVDRPGLAVLAEPTGTSHAHARESFGRVARWLKRAHVESVLPKDVSEALRAFA